MKWGWKGGIRLPFVLPLRLLLFTLGLSPFLLLIFILQKG